MPHSNAGRSGIVRPARSANLIGALAFSWRLVLCSFLVVTAACASTPKVERKAEPRTDASSQTGLPSYAADTEDEDEGARTRAERDPSPEAYRTFLASELRELDGDLPGAIDAVTIAIVHDPASVYLQVRLGELNLRAGDVDRAQKAAAAALAIDPDDIEALRLHATIANLAGDREMAQEILAHALKVAPGDRPSSTLLAELLLADDEIERAERVIDGLMLAEPGATDGYLVLARLFVERGERERALSYVERALSRDGRSSAALELKIDLLHAAGKDAAAIPTLKALVRERGDSRRTRHRLLSGLFLAGDESQAEEIVEAWLEEDDSADMLLLLSDALETAGETARALALIQRFEPSGKPKSDRLAVRLARLLLAQKKPHLASAAVCPHDPKGGDKGWLSYIRILCARSLMRSHELARAQEVLSAARSKAPANWRLLAATSQLALESKVQTKNGKGVPSLGSAALITPDKALSLIAKARVLHPLDVDLIDIQVRALEDHGHRQRAGQVLEKALRQRPRQAELLMVQARHLERGGQRLAAVAIIERLLDRSDRAETDHLNFAAFTLAEQGERLDDAQTWSTRAVLREPLNGYIVDTLGWVQFVRACPARAACDRRLLDQAIKTLSRADRLAPGEPEILLHLAEALEAQGEAERAGAFATRAQGLVEDRDPLRPRIDAAVRRLGGTL